MTGSEVEIDEIRLKRYRDKLEELEELTSDLEEWHTGIRDLMEDKPMRKAVYKTFQEAGEVVADLCAMFLSDSGRAVNHDSENIQKASGELFSEEIESDLIDLNGLRNRVVHDYNGFEDEVALESIDRHLQTLESFHEDVREWTGRQ